MRQVNTNACDPAVIEIDASGLATTTESKDKDCRPFWGGENGKVRKRDERQPTSLELGSSFCPRFQNSRHAPDCDRSGVRN